MDVRQPALCLRHGFVPDEAKEIHTPNGLITVAAMLRTTGNSIEISEPDYLKGMKWSIVVTVRWLVEDRAPR